jgi:small conductance mechanosensitive channel
MIPPLAGSALGAWSLSSEDIRNIAFITAGLVVFIVFLVASRVTAHLIEDRLRLRGVRIDMVVLSRRVAYVAVIGIGVLAAFSFAFQTANVTLIGILLATVVAALGVQDLLRDYVSGYYILLERHIRVGDKIVLDGHSGEVVEVKLRVSLVRTAEGDLLVVPNSELFTKPVLVRAKGSPEAHAAKEADATKPSEPQG